MNGSFLRLMSQEIDDLRNCVQDFIHYTQPEPLTLGDRNKFRAPIAFRDRVPQAFLPRCRTKIGEFDFGLKIDRDRDLDLNLQKSQFKSRFLHS